MQEEVGRDRGLGCLLDFALLLLAPILLQISGYSPFWLLPTAFIWNLLCRSPAMRQIDQARVAEVHGDRAGFLVWTKPFFMAVWMSLFVFAVSYAVSRWII